MGSAATELLIILFLVILNGIFSMSELAIVYARKARLLRLAEKGSAGAKAALDLAESPNRFLSTVQIGITLVGILAGTFGGASLAAEIAARIQSIPFLASYAHAIGVGVVVLGITYLSLVVGELVPKRLAMNSAEEIAARVARPMRGLSVLAAPLVWTLGVSTNALLWLLRVRKPEGPAVTEEEIRHIIKEGRKAGVLEGAEEEMVEGVFHLGDRRVGELVTHRHQVVWLNTEDPPETWWKTIAESPHHYFPVAKVDLDHLLGIVSVKDLWRAAQTGPPVRLEEHVVDPLYVPENLRALLLLEGFRRSGQHIAVVLDEYSGFHGLVTATDILEAIVGDLPVAEEVEEPDVVRRDDGSWLLSGQLLIPELAETVGLKEIPEAERGDYHTLAGFVMQRLGRVPSTGEAFDWEGFRFEVVDMDGARIDKVLVVPREAS